MDILKALYMTPHNASSVSVIIAAYNNFAWLRLCLEGLRLQNVTGFEIIIADDGSDIDTVQQIQQYIKSHPHMNIKHVWHEDLGWRKNICLNKALKASSGEYLLFMDADCIPAPDWISDHIKLRRPKTIIAGRRTTLAPYLSERMESRDTLASGWWRNLTWQVMTQWYKFPKRSRHGRVFRFPIINGHGLLERPTNNLIGCNMGLWRKDILEVNGFDERYLAAGLGEDIDLCIRMQKNGCRVVKTPHQARMVHRYHQSNIFASAPRRSDNTALLEENRTNSITYTPFGIYKN